MEYKYTGIILFKKDVGEADRIYDIYTLEAGKIQAKAVGVRKPQAKLAGALENFSLADVTVVKKQGMGKITASIVENNFPHLREEFETASNAWKSIKTANRLISTEMKDPDMFHLILDYLKTMDDIAREKNLSNLQEKADLMTFGFLFKILDVLGYKLEVSKCVKCGSKINESGNCFSAAQGGILCKNCSNETACSIKIKGNSIKLARIFFQNKISSLKKLKVSQQEISNLRTVVDDFYHWIAN